MLTDILVLSGIIAWSALALYVWGRVFPHKRTCNTLRFDRRKP